MVRSYCRQSRLLGTVGDVKRMDLHMFGTKFESSSSEIRNKMRTTYGPRLKYNGIIRNDHKLIKNARAN
jgi:hypothetical protein